MSRNQSAAARNTQSGPGAAGEGAELVVFPELSVSGYCYDASVWDAAESVPGESTERLVTIANKVGATICFGLLELDADIVYNTQVLVDGNGIIGKHSKIHMPGHEYLYWRGGSDIVVHTLPQARVGIKICYDALFPEMARTLFVQGAEVLIMPFAYWSDTPRERFPEEDITGLCYRTTCFTNGCYGIACNNAGSRKASDMEPEGWRFPGWAGVFDPLGNVAAFTRDPGTDAAMVVATLTPDVLGERRRSTYFTPRCSRPELYLDVRDSRSNDHVPRRRSGR